ncbi:MAG: pyridoxal phosphate-dependent aminotransferase [Deltaproteobacteria bacterium]|nr:MAG: pyridoxal phosphate-dependent aminotransferase [Deltaproteobacteria bacterium]
MGGSGQRGPSFSRRTGWCRDLGRFGLLSREARRGSEALIDLTESNPTRCGLLDTAPLVASLGDRRGTCYDPAPLGLPEARAAVARFYRQRGAEISAERVVLTSSSSESYSWLFKLLCDPGDRVLVPQPSYPLLPYLADLESVELVSYRLIRDEGWRIDLEALRTVVDAHPEARALVAVHPANPTGSLVRPSEAQALDRLARQRGLALIVDEVFIDYPHGAGAPSHLPSFAGQSGEALRFVLSGLSKVALLPQIKLGWMVIDGPPAVATEALGRLEVIADSYLSVSTAAQLAAAPILDRVGELQDDVRGRLLQNLGAIDSAIAARGPGCPLRRLPSDGGWYSLIEVPRSRSDDDWVARLVEQAQVLTHPGYLFDIEQAGTMVVSLLLEPAVFELAIGRAVACWSEG